MVIFILMNSKYVMAMNCLHVARDDSLIKPNVVFLNEGNNITITCPSGGKPVWFFKNRHTPFNITQKSIQFTWITREFSGTYFCFGEYLKKKRSFFIAKVMIKVESELPIIV